MQQDLSIFEKFNFQRAPVGIQFLLKKPPEEIKQLDKVIAFCELHREAQLKGDPFYITRENIECAGPIALGMEETDPIYRSGQVGPLLGVYKNPSVNRRIYKSLPFLDRNTVNYVVCSPLNKMTFEPDILVLTCNTPSQAEIVLRASTHTTGKVLTSKATNVFACSWLYIYPYISGELNYMTTGLFWGMKSFQVYPEGLILITIPFDMLTMVARNLQEINWNPIGFTQGKKACMEEMKGKFEKFTKEGW
jgi:uncharacterized protein (DUF169 family)